MKYINTREAYLNLVNETFSNEITWGGSLLGRLINSIIRKAKVEINYQKVKSIASAIETELNGLIANGLSQEDKNIISKITAKALLEEIYNVVSSDEPEKIKLYQLLDDNKEGLITQAIKYIEILPEGTNLGRGTKEELIDKLNKFKNLLDSINTEDLTEEEKQNLSDKDDIEEEEDDNELEETNINEFDHIYKLLQSIVKMDDIINNRQKTHSLYNNNNKGLSTTPKVNNDEIGNQEKSLVRTNQTNQTNQNKQLDSGEANNKVIKYENLLLGFNDFINEFKQIQGPNHGIVKPNQDIIKNKKTNNSKRIGSEEPKFKVVDPGGKKQTSDKKGDYIDYEMVDDEDKTKTLGTNQDTQNYKESDIWNKIVKIWKDSGISIHVPTITSLLQRCEDTNAKERRFLNKIAKKLKYYFAENGNLNKELLNESTILNDVPKCITYLANYFYALKDSNIIKKLGTFGDNLEIFNSTFDFIVQPNSMLSTKKEVKQLASPVEEHINYFLDLLKEADENTDLGEAEHDLEETEIDDQNQNLNVLGAWEQVFDKNEENEWKLSEAEANESRKKIENAKFEIDLTDENNKDRIIKIANLFGRAYKSYTTSVIPSGRPGGKVSNQTFREYLHLGTSGSPGTPDSPGAGPWANKRVFHSFSDYISSYIENEEYKKIFNYGKIKRTDDKLLKGNVLLEFIRDMIDETALKSYDKRRSEFLNKYFGLEGYTYKEPEGGSSVAGATKSEHAEADETLQWQSINNITKSNIGNIEKGCFLAFNVRFKLKDKKEEHKTIIGQVLEIKDGSKIILKWLYDNEAIPHAFASAKLTHGYSYTTTDLKKPPKAEAAPKEPLYIGLIDVTLNIKTKLPDKEEHTETQGIIPNHEFFMVFKDITKPDDTTDYNYHRIHFIPYKNKPSVVNRVIKNAISILVKSDKQDNKNPVIGTLDKLASKSILPTDKTINLDETIDQLTNYMERNKDKI